LHVDELAAFVPMTSSKKSCGVCLAANVPMDERGQSLPEMSST
jgi:hypothetical protein